MAKYLLMIALGFTPTQDAGPVTVTAEERAFINQVIDRQQRKIEELEKQRETWSIATNCA